MNIVNISTARLAKKKGYKESYKSYTYIFDLEDETLNYISGSIYLSIQQKHPESYADAPTQEGLRQWLIDEHDIHLHIKPLHYVKSKYTIVEVITPNKIITCSDMGTLKEVIEIGLKTALKAITIKK